MDFLCLLYACGELDEAKPERVFNLSVIFTVGKKGFAGGWSGRWTQVADKRGNAGCYFCDFPVALTPNRKVQEFNQQDDGQKAALIINSLGYTEAKGLLL